MHQSRLSYNRSDSLCQCSRPHCTLCWAAVLWPMCFTWTAYSHSLWTNSPAITVAIDTYEYSVKENWTMKTVVYEVNNLINIFRVNFAEEKRPNLNIISLILLWVWSYFREKNHRKKIVLLQLYEHLENNNLFYPHQSTYRSCHSTETALLKIVNDLLTALDDNHISWLSLLDLSAAFDTTDHKTLLFHLCHAFGISHFLTLLFLGFGRTSVTALSCFF